ncbi:hypothetical protein GCM10009530_55880 [Microbispora corallina]|uniref:Lipoprotein n=1 Tax=Microbispora corallina TaxID=83302 RepID=A0ABQ4GC45_9ACTN|nr:hypothetical protein [Microbispora corallina]GIH44651.1 hypothetical protein Mco01_76510 [Microbispora corallina]
MTTIRRRAGALGALALLAACSSPPPASQAPRPSSGACVSAVTRDALPTWARGGFSDDGTGTPHVFGERGDIVAVLFNYPPVASTDPDVANKILWVSRVPQRPMDPLKIRAVLDGTSTSVARQIDGGPGPSSVNLPKAGCWRLTLTWSGHTDAMALRFS